MTDLIELRGHTALVTGAAKRMGEAVALALAAQGVHLVLHYRSAKAEAEAVAERVRALGVEAWLSQADLAEPGAAERLFDDAIRQAGKIDFLINNASIFPAQTLAECTPEDLYANINVNALAPFLLARCLASQNRPGAIVNFLDTMIADYDRKHVPYHLSKRMLYDFTRMMALEFAPRLRVNAIAPGLVLPPEGQDIAYLEGLTHSNPLKRYGDVAGIAEATIFLLRSGFITGQVIFIDGGRNLLGSMYG